MVMSRENIGHHFEYTVLLDAPPSPGSFQSAKQIVLRKQMERAVLAEFKRLVNES